jgi:AbiV family abortive infection protein
MPQRIDLSQYNLNKVALEANENAKNFFENAKQIAEQGHYGHAYFLLTLCLEESAKASICQTKNSQITQEKGAVARGEKPNPFISISDNKITILFSGGRAHSEKRLTSLTQQFFLISNTHDMDLIKRNSLAFNTKDPTICPELYKLLKTFKKMYTLRNKATYVDKDGSGPKEITEEDYKELAKVCEKTISYQNMFASYKGLSYDIIESNLQEMLTKL